MQISDTPDLLNQSLHFEGGSEDSSAWSSLRSMVCTLVRGKKSKATLEQLRSKYNHNHPSGGKKTRCDLIVIVGYMKFLEEVW